MRKSVLFLVLSASVATPAFAQDAPNFSGARIEGIVGYDNARVEGEGSDGVNYGIGLGYDFQRGRGVFGVEAEAGDSTVDECVQDVTVAGDELCAEARRDLYVGGRAGAVVGRNVLLYGKAGYTNARFGFDYDDGATGATNFSVGDNLDGVRVGAGVELALGPNAYVKAEYRYSNYEQGISRNQGVAGFGFRF